MVFKKSFVLFVATGATPLFAVVSIIFEKACRNYYTNNPSTQGTVVTRNEVSQDKTN